MCLELRLFCGACSGIPERGACRDECDAELYRLPSPGGDFGGHALEFSLLAGVPLCRTDPHGREYGCTQTCLQRLTGCVRDRADLSRSWAATGSVENCPCTWLRDPQADRRPPHIGGDAHGKRC